MASARTCPHGPERRLLISGTRVREMLASGQAVDEHFSRPEVLEILREYYAGLDGKVEAGLHSH
jgi:sulfate adenylyltransferase